MYKDYVYVYVPVCISILIVLYGLRNVLYALYHNVQHFWHNPASIHNPPHAQKIKQFLLTPFTRTQ